jgi:hypothetical protein
LDPDTPASVKSLTFNQNYIAGSPVSGLQGVFTNPASVAVSDSGIIYVAAFTVGATGGFDSFFKLNAASGQVTDYSTASEPLAGCAFEPLYKVAITSDNSRVFFNNDGLVYRVDTATNTFTRASSDSGGCYGDYDLTLSSGQTTLEASSFLYDTSVNAESYLTLSDREFSFISYVYGTQLSADGSLLFQPATNAIDVFDGRLGILRTRIALPFELSQNYDALVADDKDEVLIAITGTTGSGIAIVDLSSLTSLATPSADTYTVSGTMAHASRKGSMLTRSGQVLPSASSRVLRSRVPHVTNAARWNQFLHLAAPKP